MVVLRGEGTDRSYCTVVILVGSRGTDLKLGGHEAAQRLTSWLALEESRVPACLYPPGLLLRPAKSSRTKAACLHAQRH